MLIENIQATGAVGFAIGLAVFMGSTFVRLCALEERVEELETENGN